MPRISLSTYCIAMAVLLIITAYREKGPCISWQQHSLRVRSLFRNGTETEKNSVVHRKVRTDVSHNSTSNISLFIAIGSGSNFVLRNALRETFLRDLHLQTAVDVDHRFFVDSKHKGDLVHTDMVEMTSIPSGYSHFARRAFLQFNYALQYTPTMTHYLRIDDDGYLCSDTLLWELRHRAPSERFMWGKYFCTEGKLVADENFMLFSRDLVELFVAMEPHVKLDVKDDATFAALMGFWQHFLRLNVWDDRKRIDAQQGYTTKFMHERNINSVSPERFESFCKSHVWAHHVKSPEIVRKVHEVLPRFDVNWVQNTTPAGVVCEGKRFDTLYDPSLTSLKASNFPKLIARNVGLATRNVGP